jgi:amino acid transporter
MSEGSVNDGVPGTKASNGATPRSVEASSVQHSARGDEHSHGGSLLGPLLCWAVVFADIGTSVYYVPGILYTTVGTLAGFFVFLTMSVFVLLTLKYAEVTHRFPQGGGVVTVAAQAINHWVGALGGMFILVDYFLTAAISCLSGVLYFSVIVTAITPSLALWITIGVLILLGILNWVGISESAKVSLVGAVVAFLSDIAILVWVFSHISFAEFLSLFPKMFEGQVLTPISLLIGFAGSFLAFSGLESISQLAPVMRTPRKRVAGIALLLVVLTVGLTSPLLTMLSTILQPRAAADPVLSAQLISLLGGYQGNTILQTEVAISASALLVFASNTAIIGAYHVFLALSRMEFFPSFILQRNRLRGTPHYSIALATGIPIMVLLLVRGDINILGDMYAFGLLGAFSLTCLGLDILRYRELKAARAKTDMPMDLPAYPEPEQAARSTSKMQEVAKTNTHAFDGVTILNSLLSANQPQVRRSLWKRVDFYLGILTTVLVVLAWSTNLVYKPLATLFGGVVAGLGMGVAFLNYHRSRPVLLTGITGRLSDCTLAVLMASNGHNESVIRTAIANADDKPVVFLYLAQPQPSRTPTLYEIVDPYLEDTRAKEAFRKAAREARRSKVNSRFIYRYQAPQVVAHVWQVVHPHDTIVAAEHTPEIVDINPDRIRYEITSDGKVAHLLKTW